MRTEKEIEQYLRSAPKPAPAPGLLEKMRDQLHQASFGKHRSPLRRWFLSDSGSVSGWRVAYAAALIIIVTLPLAYGATKAAKYLITTFEAKFDYGPDADGRYWGYGVKSGVSSSEDSKIRTKADALAAEQEFYRLYKEGKAKEVKPGVWVVELSNGERFAFGGDPEHLALSEAKKKDLLKKQFDEIEELRKAGKYERTFIKEVEMDGVKTYLYRDRFTLSDGKVVELGTGEGRPPQDNEDK